MNSRNGWTTCVTCGGAVEGPPGTACFWCLNGDDSTIQSVVEGPIPPAQAAAIITKEPAMPLDPCPLPPASSAENILRFARDWTRSTREALAAALTGPRGTAAAKTFGDARQRAAVASELMRAAMHIARAVCDRNLVQLIGEDLRDLCELSDAIDKLMPRGAGAATFKPEGAL